MKISNIMLISLIIILIVTFTPNKANAEITESELIAPEIPSYSPFEFEQKPTANAIIEPGYSLYSEIKWSEFYTYSTGIIKVWLENTGNNDLFIYKYGVQPQAFPKGKWNWSETGLTIHPNEKKYIGMTSIYIGDNLKSLSVKPCFAIMARDDKGNWYDYKTVFVEKPIEIPVNSSIKKTDSVYQVDRGTMFILANKLIFPLDSSIRNTAIQITKNHPGAYNIYQVCDLFDYVINNVTYISDPRGMEYMAKPNETLAAGAGDCDDQAILISALINTIGGTPRIYSTEDHMFAAVYIGKEIKINEIESAISKYYNTPVTLHYLIDDSGVWLLLDSTGSLYTGGLPVRAKETGMGWTFENITKVSVIDVTPFFKEIQEGPSVTDIIFCSNIRGEKDYDVRPNATYDSGDFVWMYYETSNFDIKKQDGTYEVWLKYSLKVTDSSNNIVYENLDWNDFHENSTTAPANIWSSGMLGTFNYKKDRYNVEILVKDMISGKSKTIKSYFNIATSPKFPGFEVIYAIIGISAVIYLLKRKN